LADRFKKDWSKLNSDLQIASSQRGMLAHYGVDFELLSRKEHADGSVDIEFGKPQLRPSAYNEVFVMQGKTGEKHTLTSEKIQLCVDSFHDLSRRLTEFSVQMNDEPPPRDFSQALLPEGGLLGGLRHLFPSESPSDDAPSEK
jgi:hypothetical protein